MLVYSFPIKLTIQSLTGILFLSDNYNEMSGLNYCEGFYPWGYNNPKKPNASSNLPPPIPTNDYNKGALQPPKSAYLHTPIGIPIGNRWPEGPITNNIDKWLNTNASMGLPPPIDPSEYNKNELKTNYTKTTPTPVPWSKQAANQQTEEAAVTGTLQAKKDITEIAKSFIDSSFDPVEKDWWQRRTSALLQLQTIETQRALSPEEQVLKNKIIQEIDAKSKDTSTISRNISAATDAAREAAIRARLAPAAAAPVAPVAPAIIAAATPVVATPASASSLISSLQTIPGQLPQQPYYTQPPQQFPPQQIPPQQKAPIISKVVQLQQQLGTPLSSQQTGMPPSQVVPTQQPTSPQFRKIEYGAEELPPSDRQLAQSLGISPEYFSEIVSDFEKLPGMPQNVQDLYEILRDIKRYHDDAKQRFQQHKTKQNQERVLYIADEGKIVKNLIDETNKLVQN